MFEPLLWLSGLTVQAVTKKCGRQKVMLHSLSLNWSAQNIHVCAYVDNVSKNLRGEVVQTLLSANFLSLKSHQMWPNSYPEVGKYINWLGSREDAWEKLIHKVGHLSPPLNRESLQAWVHFRSAHMINCLVVMMLECIVLICNTLCCLSQVHSI